MHRGASVGQGTKEVLLAEGTVAKKMAAPWQEWQHREETAGGWSSAQKKLPGYRCAKPWQVCDDYSAIKNELVFLFIKD